MKTKKLLNQMYSGSIKRESTNRTFIFRGILQGIQKEIKTTRDFCPLPLIYCNCGNVQIKECLSIQMQPVPKPRETRADIWKKRPAVMKYRFLRDVVREAMSKTGFVPSSKLGFLFGMQIPKLSKKKTDQMMAMPHMKRPDLDNLEKAIVDALFQDAEDAVVHMKMSMKIWASVPRIEIYKL